MRPGARRRPETLAGAAVAVAVAVAGTALAAWLSRGGGAPGTAMPGAPAPGTIMTVAGGAGGPGPARRLSLDTCGLSYADGALYAGDGAVVRRIDARTGWLTTPAGDGTPGTRGNGGPAADAQLGASSCVSPTLDAAGNLLIAAGAIHVVAARTGGFYGQQMLAGHIYTIPMGGYGGTDVRAGPAGNLVSIVTDDLCNGNCGDTPGTVHVLAERTGTFYGMPMRAGRTYTVAGDEEATAPGNGGPAARASLGDLRELSLDAAGNLLLADDGRTDMDNHAVVPPEIRVVAARDGTFYGQAMTAGHVYAIAGGGRLTGNGVPATRASIQAYGVTHDGSGNVIIGGAGRLRVVAAHTGRFYGLEMKAGDIYTVAGTGPSLHPSGDGGPAAKARLFAAFVTVDGSGNLVFSDTDSGTIRVVAVRAGTFYGVPMRAGDIYSITGSGTAGGGSGGAAAEGPLPGLPAGVAADPFGDLIIGFTFDSNIAPRFVPARAGTYFGIRMRPGRLYPVPAGGGFGLCPGAVAADHYGNVLIGDQARNRVLVAPVRAGTFYGQRMTTGRIYAVAGGGKPASAGDGGPALAAGFSPYAVATDARGDIVIVDNPGNYQVPGNRIKIVPARSGTLFGVAMEAGHIYTVAGDGSNAGRIAGAVPATHTSLDPFGAAVDAAGNLVLAADYRVRVVAARAGRFYGVDMKAGYIYTIAGPFSGSHDVAVDGHGNIEVLDTVQSVVRLIAVRSGTFYGQQMIAGHVYVVAGHHRGSASFGEGGPATQAWLENPQEIAVDPAGRLLIAEYEGQRIRAVIP